MKLALLSVSDKTGIVSFAKDLASLGYTIVSTGGTAKALTAEGIEVVAVSTITGFPEILDGRVKTLHPKIHGGILAKATPDHDNTLAEHDISQISVVAVNLYPFRETVASGAPEADVIEKIDIGGPCMLRAAAKSHARVWVVCDPADYKTSTDAMASDKEMQALERRRLAAKAFAHTASYDDAIDRYFSPGEVLRYGENPHQAATLRDAADDVEVLHGKALSFNNIIDASAGVELCAEFDEPAVVIIKHTNPAGCAIGATIEDAYDRSLACDPISAFGGIVVCNRELTAEIATKLNERFFEIVIAPSFSNSAFKLLQKKKNRRVVRMPITQRTGFETRSTRFGNLVQAIDPKIGIDREGCKVATETAPTDEEWQQLLFAWRVCKHVKSNAIVLAKDLASIGVGAGQMSRIDALELAVKKSGGSDGTVLASDAFFPFADGPEAAADAGVTAIIQPGGSKRDQEVIDACNKRAIAMVFTGQRHFRHA